VQNKFDITKTPVLIGIDAGGDIIILCSLKNISKFKISYQKVLKKLSKIKRKE